jgi:DNA-binding response OmpR family regulator
MQTNDSKYKNIKILYAEDEEGIRENISFILSLLFKEVFVAKDGEEALEYFEEKNPDLLIIDICMPRLDGIEVIKCIRKVNKDIPIIVLTAHTEQPYLFRAIELNITRYLLKPFSKDSLLDAINKCIKMLIKGPQDTFIGEYYRYNAYEKNLYFKDKILELSLNELKLIHIMSENPSKIYSFEELLEAIWGWEIVSKEALKSLVKNLRKKLPIPLIKNVFGIGYTLEEIK